jgi:hypothetical protein
MELLRASVADQILAKYSNRGPGLLDEDQLGYIGVCVKEERNIAVEIRGRIFLGNPSWIGTTSAQKDGSIRCATSKPHATELTTYNPQQTPYRLFDA